MPNYKDMVYSVRADGRLMKKITINGKVKSIYDYEPESLYHKYIELRCADLKGATTDSIKFKDYAERWLKLNSSGKADATVKEYKYIINTYLIPNFGFKDISKIKRIDIQNLQSNLLDKNHNELAHKCIRYMRTICNEAIADDFLIKNPCLNIKEPKIVHKEKEILTKEQDDILLNSTHRYAPFFRVLRYTGLRREEITALTINDIDLKNKTISVNKAVSFATNQPKLGPTKNKKSRTVPILDIIYNDIENQLNYCKEKNTKYLFPKIKNPRSMLSQESIRCMTDNFCKSIGFKITPHQLRHSYCTMLYYSGIGIKETQNLMGHQSAKMVYDLYAHLDKGKKNIADQINKSLA